LELFNFTQYYRWIVYFSTIPKYDVYEIALKPGQSADVFESTVASTVEGAYSTTGGGLQSLVLDRAKWSSPQKLSREIFPPAQ
jgi:hypothetical protein